MIEPNRRESEVKADISKTWKNEEKKKQKKIKKTA